MIMRPAAVTLLLTAGITSGGVGILGPESLIGQEVDAPRASLIRTSGLGEVALEPDRAVLGFGIQRRGSPAEQVLAGVGRIQAALLDTLTALGVPADSLQVDRLGAWPVWTGGRDSVVAYHVSASINFRIDELDLIPKLIEAALAVGVTQTTGVRWESSRAEEARAEALRLALAAARRDAETLAEAAGGRLGALVEVSTTGGPAVERFAMEARAFETTSAPAAVGPTPQPVLIRLSVVGSWRLDTP
jgi:uncharacterized protein YggE